MKPLSKKQRSSSLILLLVIFLAGVPILLTYSSGYRVDWDNFSFVKTGGIFVHSDLSGANVFIDDEFSESGGVLLKNILVQNLKSNETYKIRVEKEGYATWYKELFVHPNLVTEARVLMLPTDIPFEKIDKFSIVANTDPKIKATSTKVANEEYDETLDIFTSTTTPDKNLLVFEKEIIKSTSTKATSTTQIKIPEYLEKLNIKDLETKKGLREDSKMIAWLEAGDIHMVWTGDYQSTPFFFCDIRGCRDQIIISLDSDIRSFDFFPNRNDVFVVATGKHVFAVEADDRSKPNVQTIFKGVKPDFKLDGNTIFVKDGQDLYRAEI
ncbi:MAG: hypothetical protein WC087_03465 [Candidatus Paceibacterota bacterium]